MIKLHVRACGVAAALLLAFPFVFSAAQQDKPQAQPPRFRGGANLVRVDVFATRGDAPVQDLTAGDFEVLEDGTPQKIESFERVLVRASGTQEERVEPNSVAAGTQLIEDPHRRVFVVYLDTGNVTVAGSHDIRQPLINLLTRVLGPDDVVGLMTTDMNPMQITWARRTQVIEGGLTEHWYWGRSSSLQYDDEEKRFDYCWPPGPGEQGSVSPIAAELIARKRERTALDSLEELIRYLGGTREGRTAVIAVTNGYALYGPSESVTQVRKGEGVPGFPPIGGDGVNAGLTTATKDNSREGMQYQCDRDRMELAMMDDGQRFRDIMGEANRANVSFYPIDPRGLAPFDSDMGPEPPLSLTQDRARLAQRADSLRTLAANTDGIALLGNNDLDKQLRRASDDLTSYYLIGYYSSNQKLDGKYRTIKVKAKRPGIDIRARRGYRAPTEAEVAAARTAAAAPAVSDSRARLNRAVGTLEAEAHGSRSGGRNADDPKIFHRGPTTGNRLEPAEGHAFSRSDRIHLELEAPAGVSWTGVLLDRNGGKLAVPVTTADRTDPSTGQRWLTADITLAPLGPGDYVISLTTTEPNQNAQRLVAIRVTQ